MSHRQKTFWVTVYKTDKTFFQQGSSMLVHCHHINEGNFGMNQKGEITPAGDATFSSPPDTAIAVPAALNPQGGVYTNLSEFPTEMVAVIKIKDMVSLEVYIVDTANYNANVIACNTTGHFPYP